MKTWIVWGYPYFWTPPSAVSHPLILSQESARSKSGRLPTSQLVTAMAAISDEGAEGHAENDQRPKQIWNRWCTSYTKMV